MATHKIQLFGLTCDAAVPLVRLGFIVIEDAYQVIFLPSIKDMDHLRMTWHQDGKLTTKNGDDQISIALRQRLDDFHQHEQMCAVGDPISAPPKLQLSYKHEDAAQVFTVDFRNYENLFNISIHLSDSASLWSCVNLSTKEKNHQSFVYMKSNPFLVVNVFEPNNKVKK